MSKLNSQKSHKTSGAVKLTHWPMVQVQARAGVNLVSQIWSWCLVISSYLLTVTVNCHHRLIFTSHLLVPGRA